MLRLIHARPGPIPDELKGVIGREHEASNVNIVGWVIEGGVLKPEELADAERMASEAAADLDTSAPVILTGRGPLWLYATLVHALHYFKAVATWDPRLKAGIVVAGPTEWIGKALRLDGEVAEAEMQGKGVVDVALFKAGDKQVLHVEIKGDRFVKPEVLPGLHERIKELDIDTGKPLVIEGAMPVWMASFLTAELVHKVPALALYDPRLKSGVIVATHHPDYKVGALMPVDLAALKRKTVVIGVVGHPNSGKSVFLHVLNDALKRRGLTTLTQEGDLTAPTQEWSLHAPDVRRELKKHMNPEERLEWVLKSLEEAKKSGAVDVVLVDIGGGRPDRGELVTRENAAILQRVDAVVIVTREGEREWLEQMRRYTPNVKVAAVLRSVLHGRASYDPATSTGVAAGLDRELYRQGRVPRDTVEVAERVAERIAKGEFLDVERALSYVRVKERSYE